jgi:hypothetical protein
MGTVFWKRRPALLLGTAGLLLWVSAVVLESVEAGLVRVRMAAETQGFLEESCEIVGTTLLLGAFLWFLCASLKERTKEPRKAEDVCRCSESDASIRTELELRRPRIPTRQNPETSRLPSSRDSPLCEAVNGWSRF